METSRINIVYVIRSEISTTDRNSLDKNMFLDFSCSGHLDDKAFKAALNDDVYSSGLL